MAVPSVRPSTVDDQAEIAAVRVTGWRATYAGVVPADFLARMDPVVEGVRRRERYAGRPDTNGEFVAETGGGIVGFAHCGRYRHADPKVEGSGEVYAIYLLPRVQGQGIGRALMDAAVGHLRGHGLWPVLLWALRDNPLGRRFYQRYGFRPDGAENDYEVGGVTLPELRYRLG
jgi:GNAT superfamily N-acetyltransferase